MKERVRLQRAKRAIHDSASAGKDVIEPRYGRIVRERIPNCVGTISYA